MLQSLLTRQEHQQKLCGEWGPAHRHMHRLYTSTGHALLLDMVTKGVLADLTPSGKSAGGLPAGVALSPC